MQATEVKQAVDELGRVFEAFKQENDKKHDRSDETLTRLNDEMSRLETAINRARAGVNPAALPNNDRSPEAQAYLKFLRIGREALDPDEAKALTVGTDPTAGYLAPTEFVHEIIKSETETSPLRAVARVRQTANRAVQIPKRTGTFGAVWTAETGTRAETAGLTYGLEEVPTHEMYALVDVSEQMLEDSEFNLEQELQFEFAEQFAVTEGAAFVNGNGVGRPEGFMASADVAVTASGSASAISDADGQANGLIDLFHDLKTVYAQHATWVLNRSTLGEVRKLKDLDKNYIWQPGLANGVPNTILGAPYLELPDMPDVAANAFPIAFGDFRRAYVIIDRISLSILRDPFTQATNGNVRFIARRRVGGQVVLAEAIRKLQVSA